MGNGILVKSTSFVGSAISSVHAHEILLRYSRHATTQVSVGPTRTTPTCQPVGPTLEEIKSKRIIHEDASCHTTAATCHHLRRQKIPLALA